jgi:hypothetical protein
MPMQTQRAEGDASPTYSQPATRNWWAPGAARYNPPPPPPRKHPGPIWVVLRAGPDEDGKPHHVNQDRLHCQN